MPHYESPSTNFDAIPDFQARLNSALNTALTPENINNYAENALNEIIALVGAATDWYGYLPTPRYTDKSEEEAAAFRYFGLQDVEAILDHVSEKDAEIKALDEVIANALPPIRKVIVPTDTGIGLQPDNSETKWQ